MLAPDRNASMRAEQTCQSNFVVIVRWECGNRGSLAIPGISTAFCPFELAR
jgi:hypothetical protein